MGITAWKTNRVYLLSLAVWFALPFTPTRLHAAAISQDDETEAWYSIQYDGKTVGYEHVRVHRTQNTNPPEWSCFRKTQIQLKRMGGDFSLSATLWTEQLQDGQLLAFTLQRMDGERRRLQRSGKVDRRTNVMHVSGLLTGSRREYEIDSGGIVFSPIVTTWMPGIVNPAKRRMTTPVFFPESDGVANIVTEYRASEQIPHSGKSRTVDRLNFYADGSPSKMTTLSADRSGRVLRQEKQVLGGVLTLVEVSAEEALRAASHSIDVDSRALVAVDRLVSFTTTRKQLRMELSVSTGFVSTIPDSAFQHVDVSGDKSVVITLAVPELPGRLPASVSHRQHSALASSAWMPTQDPAVVRLAGRAVGAEKERVRISQRLEEFVRKNMKRASFSTTLFSADEVARTLRGDCTEHAVLLATLMRTKGIPARIASGLIQSPGQYGFQGHAWVEALLGEDWIPFDSTADRRTPRIKLADSELPDSASGGVSLFLPVLELAGRSRLKILSDDPKQPKSR